MDTFYGQPRSATAAVSRWERTLDDTRSPADVVRLARDYVSTLPPELLGGLPPDCRPGTVKYEDDIEFWAYTLANRYCAKGGEPLDGSLLKELLDFFLHALIRLAEMRRNLPGPVRIKAQ